MVFLCTRVPHKVGSQKFYKACHDFDQVKKNIF